jgi:DNA-binding Xre family transcriptional regulator
MAPQLKINLAYLRFINGRLTQKAVSESTGISQKTLSALETGASKGIEFNAVVKLCAFFRCTPNDLFIIEEDAAEQSPSAEARQKARHLVARGLQSALGEPPPDPEKIWDEFDAVRVRIQNDVNVHKSVR